MQIGILAHRADVSASSIRFYEAQGLLPPAKRRANGYREYDEHDVAMVRFIDRARGLGFSLSEIGAHLRSPQDDARKQRLLANMEAKRREFDTLLLDMQRRRGALQEAIDELQNGSFQEFALKA